MPPRSNGSTGARSRPLADEPRASPPPWSPYPGDHPDFAKGLTDYAEVLRARGRVEEARTLQVQSLEMCRRLFAGDDPLLATALVNLALTLQAMGRPAEAEPLSTQAVEMHRRLNLGDDPSVAIARYTLASIWEALGRRAEAVPLYESLVEMSQRLWPPNHQNVLGSQEGLAQACYYLGKYDRAIQFYEAVLKVRQAEQGPRHPATPMTMANLGANLQAAGRSSEALPLLEGAWKESETLPDLSGLVGPHLLAAYGSTSDRVDANGVAHVVSQVSEIITRLRSSSSGVDLAGSLTMAGQSLNRLRAWDAAEPLLREALSARQKHQPDAWNTFSTMSVLGETLLGQKKTAKAEPLLLDGYRGLLQREAAIPPQGRVRVPEALDRLVRLYEATGNASEAATWRKALEAARKGTPEMDRNR